MLSVSLAPTASSGGRARRLARQALGDVPDEVREVAELLVSELVTNALLHARPPLVLRVGRADGRVRVEVADGDPTLPALKPYGVHAGTGRGLLLVERLADRWAAHRSAGGKVVWFELDLPGARPAPAPAGPEPTPAPPAAERWPNATVVPVALLAAPVQAMIAADAQYDALYREFRLLLDAHPAARAATPGRLLEVVDQLGSQRRSLGAEAAADWERAVATGAATVDLHFAVPVEAAAVIDHVDALLDEADEYCRRAALLTVGPPPEAVAVRKWVFGQLAGQCRGDDPVPWPG